MKALGTLHAWVHLAAQYVGAQMAQVNCATRGMTGCLSSYLRRALWSPQVLDHCFHVVCRSRSWPRALADSEGLKERRLTR